MRWDRLFLDLEHRFDREAELERAAEADDEARARSAAVSIGDRWAASGSGVLRTRGGATMRLLVDAVGADWIAGRDTAAAARLLIPTTAIEWMRPDPIVHEGSGAAPARRDRIRFAHALRELARRRSTVELSLVNDRPTGTIDRVADDHLDLALHPVEEPRRAAAVSAVWVVPLASIDRLRWWG